MTADFSFRITKVRTRDHHASPGDPVSFVDEGQWCPVDEILDRWYEGSEDPEGPIILVLKVRSGEEFYLFRYLKYFDRWQIKALNEEAV